MINKPILDEGVKCIEAQLKDGYIDLGTHDELELQIIREAVELYKVQNRGKTLKETPEIVSKTSNIAIHIYDSSELSIKYRYMFTGTVEGMTRYLDPKCLLLEVRDITGIHGNMIKIALNESEE